MHLPKRRILLNAFFNAYFNYYPTIWIFNSRSLKVNKSVYIASRTYRFCRQYAIIIMKNVIKRVKSVKLLNVKAVKCVIS